MKTIQISDELYDRIKTCVVDPFDDTPESVIGRLIDIVDKARTNWSAWEQQEAASTESAESTDSSERKRESRRDRAEQTHSWNRQVDPVL